MVNEADGTVKVMAYSSALQSISRMTTVDPRRTITVGSLPVTVTTGEDLAAQMVEDWRRGRTAGRRNPPRLVFSANGHSVSLYRSNAAFRQLLDAADVIHADGMSVVFAARLLTATRLPERVATTDFIHDAARAAAKHGLSFYMLGGSEEANRKTTAALKRRYPGLRIAGRHHGYFGPDEEAAVLDDIREKAPDILWVGLGRPRQEAFCVRNRERLRGVTWLKTCGGLFDFLSGSHRRAPAWLQRLGLEWLHRTFREPRRLMWRYTTTNLHATYLMLRHTRDRVAGRVEDAPKRPCDRSIA